MHPLTKVRSALTTSTAVPDNEHVPVTVVATAMVVVSKARINEPANAFTVALRCIALRCGRRHIASKHGAGFAPDPAGASVGDSVGAVGTLVGSAVGTRSWPESVRISESVSHVS